MERLWKKAVAFMLAMVMCITATELPVYAGTEYGSDVAKTVAESAGWDGVSTENIYEASDYRITFTLTSYWDTGYNATIKIENTGDTVIQNWHLGFVCNNAITDIWNAEIYEHVENGFVIKNVGWNQDIAVGSSVLFGISGNQAFAGFPECYELMDEVSTVGQEDYSVEFIMNEDWESGFYGAVKVTNQGTSLLEDWVLEFDFDREITEVWDGVLETHENNHYVIRNTGYNSSIASGETVSIGMKGGAFADMSEPANYVLKQVSYGTGDGADQEVVEKGNGEFEVTFTVPENLFVYDGYEGYVVADAVERFEGAVSMNGAAIEDEDVESIRMEVLSGQIVVPQNVVMLQDGVWSVDKPQLLIGDNKLTVTVYAKDGKVAQYTTSVWNTSEENMSLLTVDREDNDKDGLENYREEQYGTNPDAADTDGDELSDIDEIFLLKTNPLVYNEDQDSDQDGLFNKEELVLNTDVNYGDTDYDGLSDYDEVRVYGTDPKMSDTDRDGMSDLVEVEWGTNPCVSDVKADGTVQIVEELSDSEDAPVEATLSIDLSPEQVASLEIQEIPENDPVLSKEMPGYLGAGSAYDFSLDGTFASATLTYTFDEKVLKEDFEPAIYYYNEDAQLLEEVENAVWDGSSISAELEHFSTYVVLDKRLHDMVWNYTLKYDSSGNCKTSLDIVFTIDDSGSVVGSDETTIRKTVVNEFIEKLSESDRGAVIKFDHYVRVNSGLTNDKERLYDLVDRSFGGGTDLSCGMKAALDLFDEDIDNSEDRHRCVIMLSDGSGPYDSTLTDVAKEKGVVIYAIGLGKYVWEMPLVEMAQGTGGLYLHASEASELYEIFDDIVEITELYKDSDGDGIVDYHEKVMAEGMLRLGTGIPLTEMDYLDADSDDDGIIDGDEIEVRQEGLLVYVKMYSNPTMKDTDGDGLSDDIELEEISTNIGNHKLSPLKGDTDGDGLSDKEELGTYYEDLGYYRVKSNPFMQEPCATGDKGAVSYVLSYFINYPVYTKEKCSEGILSDGKKYVVYTFMDTTTFDFPQRKLVEVDCGLLGKEYYVLYATAGDCVRGGVGDEIYRKAYMLPNGVLGIDSSTVEILLNALKGTEGNVWSKLGGLLEADGDPMDFLYYDASAGKVITDEEWKANIHFEERFKLNAQYDKFLPITAYEAEKMNFEKLPSSEAVYHTPSGIKNEEQKGASYKYIRADGLEAIYETLYDGSVEIVKSDYKGTRLLTLSEYPKIGPTFNYSPNDKTTGISDVIETKTSDASIAHYYFDMLPFYWWGGTPEWEDNE